MTVENLGLIQATRLASGEFLLSWIAFRSASSHMDNCGESRVHTGDIRDFRGIVIMSPKIGADSALLFG